MSQVHPGSPRGGWGRSGGGLSGAALNLDVIVQKLGEEVGKEKGTAGIVRAPVHTSFHLMHDPVRRGGGFRYTGGETRQMSGVPAPSKGGHLRFDPSKHQNCVSRSLRYFPAQTLLHLGSHPASLG